MRDSFDELNHFDQNRFWWLADMGLNETLILSYGKFYAYRYKT